MKGMLQRWLDEGQDLLELVLIPGLAAILPWPLCYRVFRFISRWQGLYREISEGGFDFARGGGWAHDERIWKRQRRIVAMVDHADFYLARTRSDRWMKRYLKVAGSWPEPGEAGLLCTFHWAAGMWGLRHAGAHGMRAHPLVATLRREHFPGRSVRYWYYRLRNGAVRDALGCEPLDTSISLKPALQALRQGEQILAAIDVPSDQVSASETIDLIGHRARMPRGLLRLAADKDLPVTVYVTGLDLRTGGRYLRITPLGRQKDLGVLMQQVFKHLEGCIQECPVAWHFWGQHARFFE